MDNTCIPPRYLEYAVLYMQVVFRESFPVIHHGKGCIHLTEATIMWGTMFTAARKYAFPQPFHMYASAMITSLILYVTDNYTEMVQLWDQASIIFIANIHNVYSEKCLEKPLPWDHQSWMTTYSWQKVPYFNVIEPVTKDHLSWETIFFMINRVVFQDRFYCTHLPQALGGYLGRIFSSHS